MRKNYYFPSGSHIIQTPITGEFSIRCDEDAYIFGGSDISFCQPDGVSSIDKGNFLGFNKIVESSFVDELIINNVTIHGSSRIPIDVHSFNRVEINNSKIFNAKNRAVLLGRSNKKSGVSFISGCSIVNVNGNPDDESAGIMVFGRKAAVLDTYIGNVIGGDENYGVYTKSDNSIIEKNIITGNISNAAIVLKGSSINKGENSIVSHNSISSSSIQVVRVENSNIVISENFITQLGDGDGISVGSGGFENVIIKSNIINSTNDGNAGVRGVGSFDVYNNRVDNFNYGVYIGTASNFHVYNNSIKNAFNSIKISQNVLEVGVLSNNIFIYNSGNVIQNQGGSNVVSYDNTSFSTGGIS